MGRCIPWFDNAGNGDKMGLFKWQTKQMSSYLQYLLTKDLDLLDHDQPEKRFKPRFFHPILEEGEDDESKKKDIKPHHIARLYSVMMARMLSGDPSIVNMYDSRSWFNHWAPAVESMPRDCLQDLYWLFHFVDDWELDEVKEWDNIYDHPKEEVKEGTATHRMQHGLFVGKWMLADESRAAGWYHSACTVGPEPKPICTGCTLHTLCVTHGDLASYKLYARYYGGKPDGDLSNVRHENVLTDQKWINLYDMMLTPFKGNRHCVTWDSAYMGDIIAQVSRNEWKINMVRTIRSDRTGADIKSTCDGMENVRMMLLYGNITPSLFVLLLGLIMLLWRHFRTFTLQRSSMKESNDADWTQIARGWKIRLLLIV